MFEPIGRIKKMAKIEWDDSLSVGVELIDEQHKELAAPKEEIWGPQM